MIDRRYRPSKVAANSERSFTERLNWTAEADGQVVTFICDLEAMNISFSRHQTAHGEVAER
jgi:hypothetical protein